MPPAKRQKLDKMKITEMQGDLFDAPDGAVLIHACNCRGSWGGGIAKVFQKRYPAAFKIYKDHCSTLLKSRTQRTVTHTIRNKEYKMILPLGTALIIPPQPEDYTATDDDSRDDNDEEDDDKKRKKHWIVCLFTSRGYGRYVSKPHTILENSVHAIRDMRAQLEKLSDEGKGDEWDCKVYSCRFNSGLFRVKWKYSNAVLESELKGMKGVEEVVVVRPEEEEDSDDSGDSDDSDEGSEN